MSIYIQPDGRARIHAGGSVIKLRPQDVLELANCLKAATLAFRDTDVYRNIDDGGPVALVNPHEHGIARISILNNEGEAREISFVANKAEAASLLEGMGFEKVGHLADHRTWIAQ